MKKVTRNKQKYLVYKKNHMQEVFSKKKLKRSILLAGVNLKLADEILDEVLSDENQPRSTKRLHSLTLSKILKRSKECAANYNIKKSIFKLGPSGFAFEIFASELLRSKGYKTKVSVIKHGKYVDHEVDVVAIRADGNLFCECKFHNSSFVKNDIKIPLYINSRSMDIKAGKASVLFDYAIFSNTKFSKDALKYANGVGLKIFSMNYPEKNTFIDLVMRYKVYPITVLRKLKVGHQRKLLALGIVTIKQLKANNLIGLGLDDKEVRSCMTEINKILKPNC